MDALIFDFDGVIVNSEPIHCRCLRQVLAGIGLVVTQEQYYADFLGYDDYGCFHIAGQMLGREIGTQELEQLVRTKTLMVRQEYDKRVHSFPGAVELIRKAHVAAVATAVCSGALREEIEQALDALDVRGEIMTVVGAQDVKHGKPHPEGYLAALDRLAKLTGRPLLAGRSVVIEDSPTGIRAGKAAGMKVLAVTNSYDAGRLTQADLILDSLENVTIRQLDELVG